MTLPSRLPCIRRNAKRPISILPLHPFAEIDALSSGVFHFNESGTFRTWRAVEDDIDVTHWGYLSFLLSRASGRGQTADIVRYRSSAGRHRRLVWIIRRFGRRPSGGTRLTRTN